jgi:hypothetical protein
MISFSRKASILLTICATAGTAAAGLGPVNDLEATGADPYYVHIAVAGDGERIAAWGEVQNNVWSPAAATATPAGVWTPKQLLGTLTTETVFDNVAVAADAAGNGLVVWCDWKAVRATWHDAGDAWEVPQTLATGDLPGSPLVAMNAAGDVVIAWWDDGFWGVARPAGGNFSAPVQLSQKFGRDARLAIDASGDGVLVWAEYFSPIQAVHYFSGIGWSSPLAIGAAPTVGTNPAVAMTANGKAIAVWQETVGNAYATIGSATMAPNGLWSAPSSLPIAKFDQYFRDQHNPDIAIDGNGDALAVWMFDDGTMHAVAVAELAAGSNAWSFANQAVFEGDDGTLPRVAFDASNHLVVAWTWNGMLYAAPHTLGAPGLWTRYEITPNLGTAAQPTAGADHFDLSVNANGRVALVWNDYLSGFIVRERDFSMGSSTIDVEAGTAVGGLPVGWNLPPVHVTVGGGRLHPVRCAIDPPRPPVLYTDLPDASCDAIDLRSDGRHAIYVDALDDDGSDPGVQLVRFNLDGTPPVLTAAANRQPSWNGWFGGDVTVRWSCTDAASGVASCPPPATITGEGAGLTTRATATDYAGNAQTASFSANIDRTPPVIAWSGNAGRYTVDQTVSISCAVSDALSGVAQSKCGLAIAGAYAFPLGTTTLAGNASDFVGNSRNATTSFTVVADLPSVTNLVNRWVTDSGTAASLDRLLAASVQSASSDDRAAALSAFQSQLSAASGVSVTAEHAKKLAALAQAIQ